MSFRSFAFVFTDVKGRHMHPQPMLHRRHYVFAFNHLIFRLVPRILNRFQGNLREVITAMNRLIGYIFGEIVTGTRGQNMWIDVCRNVKRVLTPSEWIHKFYHRDKDRCNCKHNFMLIQRFRLQILYKYIKNFTAFFIHRTTVRYLSTAGIDTFMCLFVNCTFLLAVWKEFTMHVREMQQRRHHVTVSK